MEISILEAGASDTGAKATKPQTAEAKNGAGSFSEVLNGCVDAKKGSTEAKAQDSSEDVKAEDVKTDTEKTGKVKGVIAEKVLAEATDKKANAKGKGEAAEPGSAVIPSVAILKPDVVPTAMVTEEAAWPKGTKNDGGQKVKAKDGEVSAGFRRGDPASGKEPLINEDAAVTSAFINAAPNSASDAGENTDLNPDADSLVNTDAHTGKIVAVNAGARGTETAEAAPSADTPDTALKVKSEDSEVIGEKTGRPADAHGEFMPSEDKKAANVSKVKEARDNKGLTRKAQLPAMIKSSYETSTDNKGKALLTEADTNGSKSTDKPDEAAVDLKNNSIEVHSNLLQSTGPVKETADQDATSGKPASTSYAGFTDPEGSAKSNEGSDRGNDAPKSGSENSIKAAGQFAMTVGNGKFSVEAKEAKPIPAVKTEPLYDKLTSGVKMSLTQGGKEVRLSLTPEHLGHLNIKLNIDEGSVKARILVDSAAVKSVLDADAGKLKEVFAEQGLTLDRYSIELNSNSYSAGGAGPFTENGAREKMFGGGTAWMRESDKKEEPIEAKTHRTTENTRLTTGGVDLFA